MTYRVRWLPARLSGKQHQAIARCVLACTPLRKVSRLPQIITATKTSKPMFCMVPKFSESTEFFQPGVNDLYILRTVVTTA